MISKPLNQFYKISVKYLTYFIDAKTGSGNEINMLPSVWNALLCPASPYPCQFSASPLFMKSLSHFKTSLPSESIACPPQPRALLGGPLKAPKSS